MSGNKRTAITVIILAAAFTIYLLFTFAEAQGEEGTWLSSLI